MSDARAQGLMFGEIAEEFDRIRPGYPEGLVDDVLAYTGIGVQALEVGAGTGKATTAFAARGLQITAVEPDPKMAALLTERLAGQPSVRVVVSLWEDYTLTSRSTCCSARRRGSGPTARSAGRGPRRRWPRAAPWRCSGTSTASPTTACARWSARCTPGTRRTP
ncbi:methyltransferase domain-containing protein [Catellatospora bangladeshensis]|uniref:methyltransferase domain-containing protein n=1 Tax=Catellatospora bangladeshensis TaxID=310355 RepID=UPI003616BD13